MTKRTAAIFAVGVTLGAFGAFFALDRPLRGLATKMDASVQWRAYGHDLANTKYAPLDQINRGNVATLRVAWQWTSPDEPSLQRDHDVHTWLNEATPIYVDGTLYTSTALSQVAAIDAGSGQQKWVYDPETVSNGSPPNFGFVHRGVAHFGAGEESRILIATGDAYLIALDAKSGSVLSGFGDSGRVDLTKGLGRDVDRRYYGVTSPPLVCGDVVIVGSSILDYPDTSPMPPGDVRGFDAHTGALRWTFHTIPHDGEAGSQTWPNGAAEDAGGVNAWAVMSADEQLGYVYLPLGAPTNDHFGGRRAGDNVYANSLVCLEARTGERVWHRQLVRHDLWDYDLPGAPNLVDIQVDGKSIRAVAQMTKQGFCFVFDRKTGEAVWPIEDRPAARSGVRGELASTTQPVPTKPPPFERQGVVTDDLIDFTPALRGEAESIVARYDHGPLFTPPSFRGAVMLPGVFGGASWAGAAFDPQTGRLFVPSITQPYVVPLIELPPPHDRAGPVSHNDANLPGARFALYGPQGLPLVKPPYGRITAIDLNRGTHAWQVPLGRGPVDHPALKELHLPPMGWPRRGHVLATRTLLFAAQEGELDRQRINPRRNAIQADLKDDAPALLAIDKDTGTTVTTVALPANASGGLMTYVHEGRQYVVVPTGGAGRPARLVAMALPRG